MTVTRVGNPNQETRKIQTLNLEIKIMIVDQKTKVAIVKDPYHQIKVQNQRNVLDQEKIKSRKDHQNMIEQKDVPVQEEGLLIGLNVEVLLGKYFLHVLFILYL